MAVAKDFIMVEKSGTVYVEIKAEEERWNDERQGLLFQLEFLKLRPVLTPPTWLYRVSTY